MQSTTDIRSEIYEAAQEQIAWASAADLRAITDWAIDLFYALESRTVRQAVKMAEALYTR